MISVTISVIDNTAVPSISWNGNTFTGTLVGTAFGLGHTVRTFTWFGTIAGPLNPPTIILGGGASAQFIFAIAFCPFGTHGREVTTFVANANSLPTSPYTTTVQAQESILAYCYVIAPAIANDVANPPFVGAATSVFEIVGGVTVQQETFQCQTVSTGLVTLTVTSSVPSYPTAVAILTAVY